MYGQKLANHKVLRQVKSFVKFLFEFRFLNYGFSLYPSESMACAPNGAQILLITYGYFRAIFTKLLHIRIFKFKVDRLQIILVAKKYISTCRNCSSVGCLKCVQFHNWFGSSTGKIEFRLILTSRHSHDVRRERNNENY